MAVINLEMFEDEPDALGDNVKVTTEGEFVVVHMTIWEEGVGSFELAELKIHHAVATKIGAAGVGIKQALRAAEKGDVDGDTEQDTSKDD